jgi:hypothetical protein
VSARTRIDELVEQRRQAWAAGQPAATLEKQLHEAWDQHRAEVAATRNGSTAAIIARARIERELEKLMTGEDEVD